MEKPFAAYKGDLPYIFVCYAHEDSDAVFPEISWLHDQGVRIWYDEGISPGLEWTEALASAIQGSSTVLFFVTPHSVTSEHCRRELNFAQEEDHDVVAVHLSNTDIPPGLRLSLNNRQAILRHELSDDLYRQELMQVAQSAVVDVPQPSAVKPLSRWAGLALTKTRRVSHPRVWGSVGFLLVILAVSSVFFADRLMLWWSYNAPEWLGPSVTQQIRFTETTDGVRIAYATSGQGPPLVLVVGWFTHLERGPIYDSPDIVNALSSERLLVRYDGRGFGMSDRNVTDISLAARLRDLEAVVDAVARVEGAKKVALLGVSAGSPTAISYTAENPDRVASLIIAAGTLGVGAMGYTAAGPKDFRGILDLWRSDWERPAVRSILSGMVSAGSVALQQEITDFLLLAGSGDAHAGFVEASAVIDVSDDARQIIQPTLLLAGQRDQVYPIEYTRRISALIPHAEVEILPDTSHIDTMRSPEAIHLVLDFLRQQNSE